jgi:peptide/nickel transport system substrate-binding protein
VAPGGDGYSESIEDAYPYDVEKAKQLLADAGYAEGFTLPLATNTDNRGSEVAQILVEQLAKVGVEAKLTTYDNQPDKLFADLNAKKFAAINFAYTGNMFSNYAFLGQASIFNPFDAKSPAVTEAFEALAVAQPDAYAEAAAAVTKATTDEAWFLPVASVDNYVFSQGVDDVGTYGAYGILDFLNWTPAS